MFPLRLAILVTNPLIPEEVMAQAGIDQYIMSLNRGLKHSLLENPKPYTLKIATFTSKQVRTGKKDSGLVEAAKRARILTEYFRSQKVEAYQFHDRYSSYVCIGGFDWVREGDGPDARGNPEVTALRKIVHRKTGSIRRWKRIRGRASNYLPTTRKTSRSRSDLRCEPTNGSRPKRTSFEN